MVAAVAPAGAEPVIDRALSEVQVLEEHGCVRLRIGFNPRVRYSGHVPTGVGTGVTIQVRAVDPVTAATIASVRREALRPVATKVAAVTSIELDNSGIGGPALRLEFDRVVKVDAAQGADFTSIIVSLADRRRAKACPPVFPAAGGWQTAVTPARLPDAGASFTPPPRHGPVSKAEQRKLEAGLDESRAAIRKGRYGEAIAKLKDIVARGDGAVRKEAIEMLGTAYQKSGDLAAARAQYEGYLALYPGGGDSARVSQRLKAVLTAQGEPPPRRTAARGPRPYDPRDGSTWSVAGSVSQFYIRDDSFRTLRDPSLPPVPNPDPDEHRVHRNVILSGFDLSANWTNGLVKSKFRFSGTDEHALDGKEGELISVAALYLDTEIRPWGLDVRVGRQMRSSDGVLGRFDGAAITWHPMEIARLSLVAGSPVIRRSDEPFKDDKAFVGASVGFTPFAGFDIGFYALQQNVGSFIDRQAVGTDIRYISPSLSMFSTIDYDVHFGEVNLALINASWTLPTKTVIHGSVDYRKSPFLTTWNALQGQPFLTLYDMLKMSTKDQIYQLAVDRTVAFRSASLGMSHPLNSHLQVALDFTWTNVTGSIESGGVPAMPGTGDEFYYSGQLIGSNLLKDGDVSIAGIRFADRKDSNLWVLDLQTRYPVTQDLRVGPRIRLGYLTGDIDGLKEYTVQPTLLLDYRWTKRLTLEVEAGANWSERHTGTATERTTDLFLTAGFRYDFDMDGRSPCLLPAIACYDQARAPR